jgi:Tol biopolymer transport system component
VTIADLADGVWNFALKAADEVPNWSAMSNAVSATVVDTIPPGSVTDLAMFSSSFTSVRLSWTAPGNDGAIGRASEYDLRYARTPITEETWEDAVRVDGLPRPAPSGQLRFFPITGLEPATDYFFALRSADGVPNWSALSNVLSRSTLSISISRLTFSTQRFGVSWCSPNWSPDGQTIVTCADWSGQNHPQLYLVPAGGGESVRLTHDEYPFHSYYPCWSPDGTQIAFVSEHSFNGDEIYVMGAFPDAVPFQVTHLGIRNLHDCAWSPDGTRIAFTTLVGDSPDDLTIKIYVVPSTGGAARPVVGADPGDEPAWSPGGSQIAFTSNRSGNYEIYVVPAEGGEPVRLTDDPAYDSSPAWSPDGSQIAFSSDRAGNGDIWLMSSDGGNPTQITSDPADEGTPSWSPVDARIAFVRWTSSYIGDIWILSGQEATGQ